VRGLSKADCRAGKERFSHRYTTDNIETGEYKLTVRPNCETETAKRTLKTGSLTVPADEDKIKFLMADFVI